MRKQLFLPLHSVKDFVIQLNKSESTDRWRLENEDGSESVSAYSILGTTWAVSDWKNIYLVNDSHPGEYLDFMNEYFKR